MRIHLTLTKNNRPVPFTYQEQLAGAIHSWLRDSHIHNSVSLYSFSQLRGGRMVSNALEFEKGASLFIGSWDNSILKKIIDSVKDNPEIGFGMVVREIVIQETPNLSNMDYFRTASPILIKRKTEKGLIYYYHDDEIAGSLLVETIKTKMRKAELPIDDEVSIEFDKRYPKPMKKRIDYKGISNPVSICPVIIKASNETKQFIWNVGLGNSTGIGFGAIY